MELQWSHWAVLGILLMVMELAVPAFVMVWFGLGALFVAFILSADPDLPFVFQLQIWTLASTVAVLLWFKLFKPAHHKSMSGQSSAEVVGEVGLLVSDVEPFQKGKARFQKPMMGSDVWDCISDQSIKAGSRVKVLSVEGSLFKIAKEGE